MIEQSVAILKQLGVHVVVLSGEPYGGSAALNVCVVPGLRYTAAVHAPDSNTLKENLEVAARAGLGGVSPDVWHVHNPGLGKNAAILDALYLLAEAGEALLFHVHDFAEDGRPENYANASRWITSPKVRYPAGERIGYGVLSARDGAIFAESGLNPESLFLLPNPVQVTPLPEPKTKLFDERWVLYPARGIRRKNLGELLLWAACSEAGTLFACSLSPKNPVALPVYERWEAFARELELPVRFGVGDRHGITLPELVAQSDALITTSVAEGFGLAYLEPCLWGKPLVGRNLPGVTVDFEAAGVSFPRLYKTIPIPLDWLDVDALKERMAVVLSAHYAAYGRDDPPIEAVWDAWKQSGNIDFGVLDEAAQASVISHVKASPAAQEALGLSLDPLPPRQVLRSEERPCRERVCLYV